MLPYFFRHYDSWVDRYVVYDDGSDDGSLELLAAHPRVELRRFERTVADSFVLSHTAMQNSAWHESRGVADWVVITALDEHLFVRGRAMRAYLAAQKRRGVTYLPAVGFDTISDTVPTAPVRLVDIARRGAPSRLFNKLSIFDPDAIVDTGFAGGRHVAKPTGRLWRPPRTELLLFHFKNLGYARTRDRQCAQGERLGRHDRDARLGFQYLWDEAAFRANWTALDARAIDLTNLPRDPETIADGWPRWPPQPRRPTVSDRLRALPLLGPLLQICRRAARRVRRALGR